METNNKELNLEGRTAKCSYYGHTKINVRYANDECNYGCHGKGKCECGSMPSNTNLAFFKYKPEEEQDEFYCGCMGWDWIMSELTTIDDEINSMPSYGDTGIEDIEIREK